MHRLFGLLLMLVACSQAAAATTTRDYAYQAELSDADQQLQRVELPVRVLLDLTRSDLSDIAVFNANGKMLPHSITPSPDRVTRNTMELPFHEFNRFLRQHSKTVTTREQNQQENSLSELKTTETIAVESMRRDYLIELSPQDETPAFDRIELRWTHEPAGQLLEVRVEIGNELDKLRVIRSRKSLTNRESEDPSWRSIAGFAGGQKYMRLTPINSRDSFELHRVSGHYRETEAAPRLPYQIEPEIIDEDNGRYYRFEFPSAVGAEAMRIIPADSDSVIHGDLYAIWSDLKQRRRIDYGFQQHNIMDDDVKPSRPIKLPRQHLDRIWFTSKSELTRIPSVELIYPQYEVVFLGDANSPYTLAWGNHESKPRAADLGALLEDSLDQAQQRGALVRLGDIEEAGGPARLAPQPALPWQKWLLWALLILAAIVTGRMAYRLYREMNARAPAS